MAKRAILFLGAAAWLGCGGVTSQLDCPSNRTELDGVCVSEGIADYVSCVRAQGAQLEKKDAQSLSAHAGYAGAKASLVTDVSASLMKQYAASDAATLEIIRTCKEMHASVSAAPEPPAPGWVRQGPFGAIAVSDKAKGWGWAIERASEADAQSAAMAGCKDQDCYVAVILQGMCGAIARGDDLVEYWGRQPTRAEAENRALAECQAKTTNCAMLVWACSY